MKEMFLLFFQSPHLHSLEQTKADLMESMGESRKRKDEIEVRSYFLPIIVLLWQMCFFFGKKLFSSIQICSPQGAEWEATL